MADSFDLLGLPEATTRETTDLTYLRRGGLDFRVSMLTLTGGLATVDHTHATASASSAGFMSVAMFNKLNAIDPSATNYVLPTATAEITGGVKIGAHLGIDGSGRLFVASLPAIGSGDITDFAPATRDVVGSMVVGTGTVTATYNPNGTLTINGTTSAHTHTSGQITDFIEAVQDVVGGQVVGAGSVTVGYNDTTGALTITGASGGGGATTTSGITDYVEATQDLVGGMVEVTAPLTYSYDDPAGKARLGFSMPIASDASLGGIRIDPAKFTISPTGVLSPIESTGGGGTTTGSALPRLVTIEDAQFGGSLGAGKTTAQRIANTAAFNAALAYCRDNNFALFITPGVWEIASPTDLGIAQHIIQDGAVHVFGHRSVIRQHSTGKHIWEMRGNRGSLSGVTLTYATAQTTGDSPLDAGRVKTITVTSGGTGYTTAPTVTITNVGGGSPSAATATAVISGGAVTAVNVVGRGANYTTAPAISLSGGGGSGATARAEIYAPHASLMMNGTTGSTVRDVRSEFAWAGLFAPQWSANRDNRIDTFTAANVNGYGVAWSNGTGNAWSNITVTGEGVSPPVPCTAGFWLNGHSNSSVSKLSIDSVDCQQAVRQTGSRAIAYAGLNIENVRPRVLNTTDRIAGLFHLEADSQSSIAGMTVNGTDMNSSSGTSPLKLRLFAHKTGARATVTGLRVTNTRNKAAGTTQDIALIGPPDTDIQSNRGVAIGFTGAVLDRAAATPHLIDRLSAHVIDTTGEDRTSGLIEFNTAFGGSRGDSADWGMGDVTVYPDMHGQIQRFGAPLTNDMTVTISNRIAPPYGSSGQYFSPLVTRGFRQSIIRLPAATGEFLIDVNGHDAAAIASLGTGGDRLDLEFDGTRYVLADSAVQLFGTPGAIMGFDTSGAAATVPNTRAIAIPLTTETGVLAAGANLYRFVQPFGFRLTGVMASANKASSSGTVTLDVLVSGTSILSPKLTIPASSTTSATFVMTTTIPAMAAVAVNCDAAGTGAEGVKVYLIGYPVG